jgi:hypothetical protein
VAPGDIGLRCEATARQDLVILSQMEFGKDSGRRRRWDDGDLTRRARLPSILILTELSQLGDASTDSPLHLLV